MNVLEPIWVSTFTVDTYSCIKGRGIHGAMRKVKKALRDKENTRYCLKIDVRKFYPSIDHDILKQVVRRKIKCADTLKLLDTIIDSAVGIVRQSENQSFFRLVDCECRIGRIDKRPILQLLVKRDDVGFTVLVVKSHDIRYVLNEIKKRNAFPRRVTLKVNGNRYYFE